ncbi:protein phosphatase 1H isoform X1 [Triplophysa rosa]|uniref:Protein phosphatase 1H n=1 Tax=Triplophysa rosa TaxID=992332 RepID=A0A9W7WZH2_TRIRA|nr:protein phosphatase 1H isoform X1 [Triplophysa rosa]KAI7811637.1 protein phosphatase 1H [Triplophysa rosa]
MMTRVRSAVSSILGGMMSSSAEENHAHRADPPLRFQYCRPEFLALSPDEVECSADHISRPILILKDSKLPWATGYAEVINAGKSALNEDQACCEVVELRKRPEDHSSPSYTPTSRRRSSLPSADILETIDNPEHKELNFHYWGLFDGHGGSGAAVFASKFLHLHVEEQLQEVLEILQNPSLQPPTCLGEDTTLHPLHPVAGCSQRGLSRAASLRGAAGAPGSPNTMTPRFFMEKKIKQESLVVGAIENAFKEMDAHIGRERAVYLISGGCTALVVIYLLGKLYVANAGDSRALIVRAGEIIPMSNSFTPESERQRLQFLAHLQPSLLGNDFTHLEFPRRVTKKEVGKRMLYRDFTMNGWAYKTVQEEDLKFPLIYGEGKKARVLATIGISRGLGDHDLKVHDSDISIKPFLSCSPEVKVYDLSQCERGADDVMVLATDGLWDVLSNEEVAEAITGFLGNCDPDDQHRYTMTAQDLVMKARGVLKDRGWRIAGDRLGSGDDISVFIIPLMHSSSNEAEAS